MERDEKQKVNGRPRFSSGHMCAGCPVSRTLHTGCVVGSDVKVVSINGSVGQRIESKVASEENSPR